MIFHRASPNFTFYISLPRTTPENSCFIERNITLKGAIPKLCHAWKVGGRRELKMTSEKKI